MKNNAIGIIRHEFSRSRMRHEYTKLPLKYHRIIIESPETITLFRSDHPLSRGILIFVNQNLSRES